MPRSSDLWQEIDRKIKGLVPNSQKSSVEKLSLILSKRISDKLSTEEVERAIADEGELQKIITLLQGKSIETSTGVINFGSNAQAGDINTRDIAGRDIINTSNNISNTSIYISIAREGEPPSVFADKATSYHDASSLHATGDRVIRNQLWNIFYSFFGNMPGKRPMGYSVYIGDTNSLLNILWVHHFNQPVNEQPEKDEMIKKLQHHFMNTSVDEIVQIIEIACSQSFDPYITSRVMEEFNNVSQRAGLSYRFVDGRMVNKA